MPEPKTKLLSAFDATLLVMGGIIGIGIFFNPASIAERAYEPWAFLLVWGFCGVVALCAAFTFAELAGSFPRTGGWYVYLREAFGPYPAFLFAWVVLGVITTGAIAAVGHFCAEQLQGLLPGFDTWLRQTSALPMAHSEQGARNTIASALVLLMTAIALSGVKRAAVVQNACMLLKLLAMGTLVVFGIFLVNPEPLPEIDPSVQALATPRPHILRGILSALLPAFFAFGGWQMVSYIAPQVRDPKRTLPRAIVLGVLGVTVVYLSINYSYLSALGIEGLAGQPNFAATIATRALGESGADWLRASIVVSAMGWVMVTIFTAPWLYVAMARDKLFFQSLGHLSPKQGVPAIALCLQCVICLVYIWVGSISFLVDAVVSIEWIFHGLAAWALIRMRRRQLNLERPFVSPFFPLAPIVYALAAITVVLSSFLAEGALPNLLLSAGLLLAGSVTFHLWSKKQLPS